VKKITIIALLALMALTVFSPAALAQDDADEMDDDAVGVEDDAGGVDDGMDDGVSDEDDDFATPQQSGAGAQYDDDLDDGVEDDGAAVPGGTPILPDTGGPALLLIGGALLALGAASFGIGAHFKRR